MSQTVITTAFEQWKVQEVVAGKLVQLDEFVFANVPGLDPDAPIDRDEGLPPAAQIVHRQAVNKVGTVNNNAVVYSVTLGTDIGDFDFNWIGLLNKVSGTVGMIVHAPTQRKIANANGQQGNAITRSFLMEFDGATAETGITTPAETWQIDFTARLSGIDEMQRLINRDHYGAAAFFANGFLVAKTGAQHFVTAGTGYIGGLRTVLANNKNITVGALPTKVWADVSYQGNVVSQWESVVAFTLAADKADYTDANGFKHYVFAVASIAADGKITDLRPKGSLGDQQGNNDFLRKDDNLAALKDKAKSRENLGLKAAALRDVGTANGQLMEVNAFGLGGYGTDNQIEGAAAKKPLKNGFYGVTDEASYGNAALISWGFDRGSQIHLIAKQGNTAPLLGICGSTPAGVFGGWAKIYTEFQKPTAVDVGALPITGGTMTGVITTSIDGRGSFASQNTVKAPVYQDINSTSSSEYWPLVKQRYVQGNATWSIGTLISDGRLCIHFVSASDPAGKLFYFGKDGTLTLPNYANFDAKYQARGNYTPAGQAYTKAESDGKYQLKGNFTPAGQAYTKAESDARYIQNVRYSAEAQHGANGVNSYHSNTVLTGFNNADWDYSAESLFWSYIQIYKNGQWVTIGR